MLEGHDRADRFDQRRRKLRLVQRIDDPCRGQRPVHQESPSICLL
jgi:hypothetical protein